MVAAAAAWDSGAGVKISGLSLTDSQYSISIFDKNRYTTTNADSNANTYYTNTKANINIYTSSSTNSVTNLNTNTNTYAVLLTLIVG